MVSRSFVSAIQLNFNGVIGDRMVVTQVSICLRCHALVFKAPQTAEELVGVGSLSLALCCLCS
jgi:hypothetical protein